MSKHTPGPWRADCFTIRAECNDIVIANMRGPDLRNRGSEWKEDMDYRMGNVRLAAAAPELLEALSDLLAMCQRQTDFNDDGDGCMFDRCRAAITKATGE